MIYIKTLTILSLLLFVSPTLYKAKTKVIDCADNSKSPEEPVKVCSVLIHIQEFIQDTWLDLYHHTQYIATSENHIMTLFDDKFKIIRNFEMTKKDLYYEFYADHPFKSKIQNGFVKTALSKLPSGCHTCVFISSKNFDFVKKEGATAEHMQENIYGPSVNVVELIYGDQFVII